MPSEKETFLSISPQVALLASGMANANATNILDIEMSLDS